MKKYLAPSTIIFTITPTNCLASSGQNRVCGKWHTCRDRSNGIFCIDKKSK